MSEDRVRVLRMVEFVGPRTWVEEQVARSLHGTRIVKPGCEIRTATVGDYPEILHEGDAAAKDAYADAYADVTYEGNQGGKQ